MIGEEEGGREKRVGGERGKEENGWEGRRKLFSYHCTWPEHHSKSNYPAWNDMNGITTTHMLLQQHTSSASSSSLPS